MSVCSLLSIYGNLVYNNEKILFTVVYVPMTVIETGKSLAFLLFVIIYNIIWYKYIYYDGEYFRHQKEKKT